MIYIIHGDNEASSRNTILALQKKHAAEAKKEVLFSDVTPEHLYTLISNFDFFGNPPFTVFNISNYGHAKLDVFLPQIKQIPEKSILLIYADKALSATNIFLKETKALNAVVLYNPATPSANSFKFSDYLLTGQRQKAYKELKLLLDHEDVFQILGALTYTLRAATLVKFNSTQARSLPPFVKGKAENFASKFTEDQLTKMYELLYKYDKELKVGAIPSDVVLPIIIEGFTEIAPAQ